MPSIHSRRGAVDPVTLCLIAALALGGAKLAGWKPLAVFQKKPPTEQVTKLQADLAAAQAELERARQERAAAEAAERLKQEQQVRWAQQMAEGASAALARQPAEHRTAETQLASDLLARSNVGLAAAIGALPPDKQAEILRIVDQALSRVQAERDEARAALCAKDSELQLVTQDREAIKAQIPVLSAKLATQEAVVHEVQSALTLKTNEVKTWAQLKQASDREAGSLSAALGRWVNAAIAIGCAYVFLAYVLPGLLKHLDDGPLKRSLRNISGYLTSGLLYHDAKKKLSSL